MTNAEIRTMLRELGRVRREIDRKAQRRQLLNALGYIILTGGVVTILLSL